MTKRRKFTPAFKAKIALEALSGEKTIQEIAALHGLHPNQVSTFKREAMEGLEGVFAKYCQEQLMLQSRLARSAFLLRLRCSMLNRRHV